MPMSVCLHPTLDRVYSDSIIVSSPHSRLVSWFQWCAQTMTIPLWAVTAPLRNTGQRICPSLSSWPFRWWLWSTSSPRPSSPRSTPVVSKRRYVVQHGSYLHHHNQYCHLNHYSWPLLLWFISVIIIHQCPSVTQEKRMRGLSVQAFYSSFPSDYEIGGISIRPSELGLVLFVAILRHF